MLGLDNCHEEYFLSVFTAFSLWLIIMAMVKQRIPFHKFSEAKMESETSKGLWQTENRINTEIMSLG